MPSIPAWVTPALQLATVLLLAVLIWQLAGLTSTLNNAHDDLRTICNTGSNYRTGYVAYCP
jgi:hypothetical protein